MLGKLRHSAVPGGGTSDATIMAIADQVSRRMLQRYSHVRMEAKCNRDRTDNLFHAVSLDAVER